tara:strand:- start:323 stop:646 length:324 start_codon:yes stop_codon:yes gene_type:complete
MNTQNKNSPTDKTKNKLYTFVQREEDDYTCLKLLSKEYDGIIYKYGKVGFGKEENPDGTLPMIFDYDILKNPNKIDLGDETKFVDHIGDILLELMEKQIKDGTAIIK